MSFPSLNCIYYKSNKMETNRIHRIIRKYLSNRFSAETEEKVQKWIIKDKDAEAKEEASFAYWNELEPRTEADTYPALERVNRRIGCTRLRRTPFYQRIARIAAVLIPLFIIAGGYLYYSSTRNGLIEISVAYGEEKHFLLPDSSEIWLNAGTIFKYPKNFAGDERRVYLDGEAYFSVKRNATKPFIVETSQLSVKVLGTKFNVKAYSDDEVASATLTSGKVEVKPSAQSPQILKPNEQLTYNRSTARISVAKIPSTDTDSWITGKLIFTNASFNEIQQTLERRYNIIIENALPVSSSKRYTVRFLKNERLDEILNVLGDIIGFDYRRDGSNIKLISKP